MELLSAMVYGEEIVSFRIKIIVTLRLNHIETNEINDLRNYVMCGYWAFDIMCAGVYQRKLLFQSNRVLI